MANPAMAARIVVVSDRVARGERTDEAGSTLQDRLTAAGFTVEPPRVVPDGLESVASVVGGLSRNFAGLLVTTGGTGFGPRDLTPEGTARVIERHAPGMAEAMRAISPLGRLSRGLAGVVGECLILNLPGSPKGAVECLDAVLDVVPHALNLLVGGQPH